MNLPDTEPTTESLKRIVGLGTTGSGKSTLARQLGRLLGIPCVELDALNWDPNWSQVPDEVFRERVAQTLSGLDRWVVDGNYGKARDLIWPRATMIIWLDYPLRLIFWRLFWRTLRRCLTREVLWNGNREQFRVNFFSRQSLFLWALQTHSRRRRTLPATLALPEHAHLHVVRLKSPRGHKAMAFRYNGPRTQSIGANLNRLYIGI